MDCPVCGRSLLSFPVPEDLLTHVPDGGFTSICPQCLTLHPASDAPDDPDFSPILESFPDGDAGGAMALGVGLIVDSLALNRAAIGDCMDYASDRGVDPWLLLERLDVSGSVQTEADLERAKRQLEQLRG